MCKETCSPLWAERVWNKFGMRFYVCTSLRCTVCHLLILEQGDHTVEFIRFLLLSCYLFACLFSAVCLMLYVYQVLYSSPPPILKTWQAVSLRVRFVTWTEGFCCKWFCWKKLASCTCNVTFVLLRDCFSQNTCLVKIVWYSYNWFSSCCCSCCSCWEGKMFWPFFFQVSCSICHVVGNNIVTKKVNF